MYAPVTLADASGHLLALTSNRRLNGSRQGYPVMICVIGMFVDSV